jgi:flagellar basal-body rod protein FlgC
VFQPHTVGGGGQGVAMSRVAPDLSAFKTEYAPGQPGADSKGYVKLPNVDPLIEAMDMREAQQAYEANLNVIETARAMDSSTLDIIKK